MAFTTLDAAKAKNVLRQVEFYFSDSNLPRDRFLMKSIEESEDGLVSLALICTFKKMRGHLGMGEVKLEKIPEETMLAVAETLRKSVLLQVFDDDGSTGSRVVTVNQGPSARFSVAGDCLDEHKGIIVFTVDAINLLKHLMVHVKVRELQSITGSSNASQSVEESATDIFKRVYISITTCAAYEKYRAANDPIAPSRAIPRAEIMENPHCLLIVTPQGGHLGWIAGDEAPFGAPWTDAVVMEFLEHLREENTKCSEENTLFDVNGVQQSP